jgi:hypothetical protein
MLVTDYANANRLQQDHPCVIELIRSQYLYRSSPPNVPLNLSHPEVADPSAAQSKVALTHLHNQVSYIIRIFPIVIQFDDTIPIGERLEAFSLNAGRLMANTDPTRCTWNDTCSGRAFSSNRIGNRSTNC